jgi:hypothetical protein
MPPFLKYLRGDSAHDDRALGTFGARFPAGIAAQAKDAEGARRLVANLASAEAVPALKANGNGAGTGEVRWRDRLCLCPLCNIIGASCD